MSTYNDVIKHLAYVHFIKKANLDEWHGEAIIDLIYGQQRAGKDIKTLSEVANQHADALKAIQQYQTVHGLGDLFSSTLSALWMLHLGRKLKKLSRHPVLTTPIPEWYV